LILYISGVVILAFTASLLLFRIHVKGEFSSTQSIFEIVCIWFAARMDFNLNKFSGRVLFINLPIKKREQSSKSDKSFNNAPKPKKRSDKTVKLEKPVKEEKPDKARDTDPAHSTTEPSPKKSHIKKVKPRKRFKSKSKKAKKKSPGQTGVLLRFFWAERKLVFDILRRIVSGTVSFVKKIRTDYLKLNLEFGAGDPATTGIIFGILQPVRILNNDRIQFDTVPDFEDERINADFTCSFSIIPIQVFFVVGKEMLSFPWIRVTRTGWRFYQHKRQRRPEADKSNESKESLK